MAWDIIRPDLPRPHNDPERLARTALLSIIQAAGWPIWPLILCSVVALALVIERFMRLRPLQVAPPMLLDEVIGVTRANLPPADVINKLADNSVLGAVLAAARSVIASPSPNRPCARPLKTPAAWPCTAWSATSTPWAPSLPRRPCWGFLAPWWA
jgi:hypothetical protein